MYGEIKDVLIEFDPDGSLATTHESQGSDMGLFGGFLGWEPTDERLVNSPQAIQEAGINVKFKITPIDVDHPNTYKMTVTNPAEKHTLTAISTGGGIIEVIEIDGVKVSMAGDYYETLINFGSGGDRLLAYLRENISADGIHILGNENTQFVEIKSQVVLAPETIFELQDRFDIQSIKQIAPVLPVTLKRY